MRREYESVKFILPTTKESPDFSHGECQQKGIFYTIWHKYLYLGIDISWTCWYTLDKSFPNGY